MRFTFILKDGNSERDILVLNGEAASNAINDYMALYTNEQLVAMDDASEIQLIADVDETILVLYV